MAMRSISRTRPQAVFGQMLGEYEVEAARRRLVDDRNLAAGSEPGHHEQRRQSPPWLLVTRGQQRGSQSQRGQRQRNNKDNAIDGPQVVPRGQRAEVIFARHEGVSGERTKHPAWRLGRGQHQLCQAVVCQKTR